MTMPGGGYHKVAAGQITDDSELALCLLKGLVESNRDNGGKMKCYNVDLVGLQYNNWINSDPFDYGDATEMSLGLFNQGRNAFDVLKIAASHNSNSKSNGSLMKVTPLAVWAAQLENSKNYD